VDKKVIVVGALGLVVGFAGGAAAAWGLDPADEPASCDALVQRLTRADGVEWVEPALEDD
jgi:hypothetical protein